MKHKFLISAICIEIFIIVFIGVANAVTPIGFALFYNIIYGLALSVMLPILFLYKNKESFSTVGVKKLKARQYIVLAAFVAFSVGGQIIPLIINKTPIRFDLLPICILPLIMTTFFEEFLFRGLIQTRIEKQYGWIVAILLSGALFSLYHIGYPGFRNISDLLLLFVVGIGFSVAYKLSDNNLIVAYFVNLPNAFVTYMLKSEQFPAFTPITSIFAALTIAAIAAVFIFAVKKLRISVECIKKQ